MWKFLLTKQKFFKNLKWHLLISLVFFSISLAVLESKRTTNPYYYDEVSWICNGRVWNELTTGRWNSQVWTEDYVQTRNPQLGKYILGFWIQNKYGQTGFQAFNCPGWGSLMWTPGLSALTFHQREILFWSRIPMMILGAVSVALLYVISTQLFFPLIGATSAVILLLSPLFQVSVNRAMPDSPLLLFFLITILLIRLESNTKDKPFTLRLKYAVILGVCTGLAISTKPYGLLLPLFIIILWFTQLTIHFLTRHVFRIHDMAVLIINIGVLVLTMSATMFIFNPTFWGRDNTFINWVPNWFTAHRELAKLDSEWNKQIIFITPLVRVTDLSLGFVFPGNWIYAIITPFFNVVSFFTGLCIICKQTLKQRFESGEFFLVLWFAAFILLSPLYVQFRYYRYYIPLLPPFILIEAIGLFFLLGFLVRLFKHLVNPEGGKILPLN